MENKRMYNLEDLLDKNRFADLNGAIVYGDRLIGDINRIYKFIVGVINDISSSEYAAEMKSVLKTLVATKMEVGAMKYHVENMQSFISQHQQKKQPSQSGDIGATEGMGFTEEEIERTNKLKENLSPEQKAILEKYDERNQQSEEE